MEFIICVYISIQNIDILLTLLYIIIVSIKIFDHWCLNNLNKATMTRVLPKKSQFRMRAHINPFNLSSFAYPPHHTYVDWAKHFPAKFGLPQTQNLQIACNTKQYPSKYQYPRPYLLSQQNQVKIIDIGCGFGGLLFSLSPLFPQKLILGLQIRDKVTNYVAEKIRGSRMLNNQKFNNISVVRTNSMRHLCQYFPKQSLEKIFICFPDPHFKPSKYRRRIINVGFLSQYAYLLKQRGKLYCATDIESLHQWHLAKLRNHRMFKQNLQKDDPCIQLMLNNTEQSKKVHTQSRNKYWAVFQKISP